MLGQRMMSGKRTIGLVAAVALQLAMGAANASGQAPAAGEDKTLAALSARTDDFFEAVSESASSAQVQSAYDKLLFGSQLKQDEQVAGLVRKTAEIQKTFGAYRGFEQIMARRVGKDLVLMRYLYKCDNFPVVWHMAYYRDQRAPRLGETTGGAEGWRVISIRFDTDLEALAR
jgi:hypothetical protein